MLAEARRRGGLQDRVRVDPVEVVEIWDVARLAEPVDAERIHGMTSDAPKPRECRRMPIKDSDQSGIPRELAKQSLDV